MKNISTMRVLKILSHSYEGSPCWPNQREGVGGSHHFTLETRRGVDAIQKKTAISFISSFKWMGG